MEFEYFRALKTEHYPSLIPTKKNKKNQKQKQKTLIVPLDGCLEINITFPEKVYPVKSEITALFLYLELYFVEDG